MLNGYLEVSLVDLDEEYLDFININANLEVDNNREDIYLDLTDTLAYYPTLEDNRSKLIYYFAIPDK
jgi:hypothetical protein